MTGYISGKIMVLAKREKKLREDHAIEQYKEVGRPKKLLLYKKRRCLLFFKKYAYAAGYFKSKEK
jgi:hypothetical protein